MGEWNGAAIIDDYAHNPFKIAAALKAPRARPMRPVVAMVQPHRYTRLRDTFEQFALPERCRCRRHRAGLYGGRAPIEGIDRDTFAEALRAHGHRNVRDIDGEGDLAAAVAPFEAWRCRVASARARSPRWMHGLQKKRRAA